MQKQTFTQKLWRQRNILSFLLPLLALFTGLDVNAQSFNSDNITITANPTGTTPPASQTTVYDGLPDDNNTTPNLFQGKDLGGGNSFSLTTGTLMISGAFLDFSTTSARPATAGILQYRVFPTGAAIGNLPNYSTLSLPQTSPTNNTASVTFENAAAAINLLTQPQVLGGGNYTLDIQYIVTYTRAGGSLQAADPGNGGTYGYRATFSVIAPPVTPPNGTSTWISTLNTPSGTNWRLASNWSNGVPTRFSDAVIPGKTTQPTGVSPLLNDPSTPYEVRTLTLLESSNSSRATLIVAAATLSIYGDLNQPGGGITASTFGSVRNIADPTQNSTIIFSGMNDQVIRGSLVATDVRVAGSGIKSVVNRLTATNTLMFAPANPAVGVLLQTAVEANDGSGTLTVNFDTSTNTIVDIDGAGALIGTPIGTTPETYNAGETQVSFVRGVMRSNRTLTAGVKNTFGNIGLDITASRSTVGTVIVTRIVGDALNGPIGTSATAVKRQYQVLGEVNSDATTPASDIITSEIVFHYLDSSTGYNELNGNTNENNLMLFRTVDNGVPFQPLYYSTPDPAGNTVTRVQLTTINTVTLGDRLNPLPVTLTTFDAKRVGNDALVTWNTASEVNNKGFNVQVSTDGTEYRTVGFVASKSANSATAQSYSFTDSEKNKVGTRYYRLQQVDIDGKTAYFTPRMLSFEGKGSASEAVSILAYPNPFTNDVRLNLISATEGKGSVVVTDMTGRVISQRALALTNGSNDIEMTGLGDLKSGIYMMRVTLPTGITQNLKVVKQ